MSRRFHRLAATLALSLLTASQAFAFPVSQSLRSLPIVRVDVSCYTQVYINATVSRMFARQCDAGEKPRSVRVVYNG